MHLQLYQPFQRRTTCLRGRDATVSLPRTSVLGSTLATAKAAGMVERRQILGPLDLAETNGSISSLSAEEPHRAASLPFIE